ncbi:CopY/TcrY family copper transport repressor [Fructilactobacillus florum]|uniref:Uncharacterized protein n=1 Tax=Fructilactobacillus florum DSM 22689 = JCM 16035 TaxID=1423745 RepID=A0A0R2CQ54_9LACO|nr:CopY/TcrY family copper transport repressor [Fructilactobacillus florum]KRM90521.1 hypothetical protein FC87_GL001206 [Fructilactobacillus florum DSM 22689 = JCM 16035]
MTEKTVSGAEWSVLRIVWTLGSCTTREVIDTLQNESDWKDSTIKTLLKRLCDKEFLTTTKQGRQFTYQAVVNEQTAMNQTAVTMFSHFCAMKQGQTLIELIEQEKLSRSDLQKIEKLAHVRAMTAPEQVDCNCLPDGTCD